MLQVSEEVHVFNTMKWIRVNRKNPCPACGKPDWCMFLPDGTGVVCMRVQSHKPVKLKGGEVGYKHPMNPGAKLPPKPREEREPIINAAAIMKEWWIDGYCPHVNSFANRLGVTYDSLCRLQCAFAPPHKAWAFPMKDGGGNIVGIRLRDWDGNKWAVKGSHQGLFIPMGEKPPTIYIVEGPTDCAAALSLGLYAIGRPSCGGGVDALLTYIARTRIGRVVIVADNDSPGLRGAETLSEHLTIPHTIITLPVKDVRAFAAEGGTKEVLQAIESGTVWKYPRKQTSTS